MWGLGYPKGSALELLDGTLKLRHSTDLFTKRFHPMVFTYLGSGVGKRHFVTTDHLLDAGSTVGKRVRLTKKTRPYAASYVILDTDPGHSTPRRWRRLRSPSSEGEEGEVGVPRNLFSSPWGWGEFCTWGRLEPALGGNRLRGFSGWTVQPKGPAHWRRSVLIRCITVGVHGQTRTSYIPSAPQPPQAFHSRLHLHSCFVVIFTSGTQTGDTMMGVARDGGGTSCARRRRKRRLRSFLRHERMAVALHLAKVLHYSSGASLEPVAERREEEEVEAEVVHDVPRGQEQPPPGMLSGSLSDPGPPQQVAATVGYVAAWVPRLTPVVLVQDAVHDDKTLAWLLKRSLDERQREKEEAEEAEVVKQLEDVLAEAEDKLLGGVGGVPGQPVPPLLELLLSCAQGCGSLARGRG